MSLLIRKSLCRSPKVRFYSAQAAKQKPETLSEVTATNVDGLTVLTADEGAPLTRVSFVAKAGSRYCLPRNYPGITHVIRHAAYMGTNEASAFKIFKHIEAVGATFTTSTSREYAMTSFSCTRNILPNVFDLVAPTVTRQLIPIHEWNDVGGFVENITRDVADLNASPNLLLLEELHAAAYRDTLGTSLYSPNEWIGFHDPNMILSFMLDYYTPERMALVATGADHEELVRLAKKMKFNKTEAKVQDPSANYVAGERRLFRPDNNAYVAFAVEGPSQTNRTEMLSAAVLQQILGVDSRIKYSSGATGSKLIAGVGKAAKSPVEVNAISCNYTDSGLFGVGVSAEASEIDTVVRAAVDVFKNVTQKGVSDAEVAMGKSKVKAYISMSMENGDNVLSSLAEQSLGSDKITSLTEVLNLVDGIQTTDVNNVAKKLGNGKFSLASVGDVAFLSYKDELFK